MDAEVRDESRKVRMDCRNTETGISWEFDGKISSPKKKSKNSQERGKETNHGVLEGAVPRLHVVRSRLENWNDQGRDRA